MCRHTATLWHSEVHSEVQQHVGVHQHCDMWHANTHSNIVACRHTASLWYSDAQQHIVACRCKSNIAVLATLLYATLTYKNRHPPHALVKQLVNRKQCSLQQQQWLLGTYNILIIPRAYKLLHTPLTMKLPKCRQCINVCTLMLASMAHKCACILLVRVASTK